MAGSPNKDSSSPQVRYRPLDPDTIGDPVPIFESLIAEAPVIWDDELFAWVVSGEKECRRVLQDTDCFVRDRRRIGRPLQPNGGSIQSLDPPEHLPLRLAFVRALEQIDTEKIAEGVCQEMYADLSVVQHEKIFDYMVDLAAPAAIKFAVRLVGLQEMSSEAYYPIFLGLTRSMDDALDKKRSEEGLEATLKLIELVSAAQVASPPDSLLGYLAVDKGLKHLPDDYVCNTIAATFNAAFSTAYASMGSFMKLCLERPGLAAKIARSTDIKRSVEELLRFTSPAQSTRRYVLRDTVLGGVELQANDPVLTLMAAANRDPVKFHAADELVLDRSSNPHLTFGAGPHFCIGRKIAIAFLSAYSKRLENFEQCLRSAGPPVWLETFTLRCLERLPVERCPSAPSIGISALA